MRSTAARRGRHAVAAAVAGVLLVSGCSASGEETTGPGVTSEPCPQAVDENKGCIYLGVLSDLGGGPFAALGTALQDGQHAFWSAVNRSGGIGGRYEVDDTTFVENTSYDPTRYADAYAKVQPHVLALAMSLGTSQTQTILGRMDGDDMLTGAGTLWSGWQYAQTDRGLVLEIGYSYCTEAVLGLDWLTERYGRPERIAVVAYSGNYGEDYASGARTWAMTNNVPVTANITTASNRELGNQNSVVQQVLADPPDAVVLATGPAETGEIVGKLVQRGYPGRFIGSLPTWNAALLDSPAGPALTARYATTAPFDGWDGASAGAVSARAAAPRVPANWGYNAGWALSYPMRAVLEKVVAAGTVDRASLRAAVAEGLPVDFEGMLPPHDYAAGAPDPAAHRAVVGVPDAAAPGGLRTVATDYHGPTSNRLQLTEPCIRF
ncbi:ABC transporter substrate-binding protein [Nocardia cyriacigeorgica]|uniref:ABC transporter substrate-binding protein n=1 Tax=Nocardia cyriacigeorgica TaxID=135487 RepID=A0A5R8NPK8_9NOCA|nr:ABC transporter substrate-binding protein [Nocardia cyriacigeorgica]TLF77563.1 ABC transporter substrate-binding protein [Nocardia cyriacigeorgica]